MSLSKIVKACASPRFLAREESRNRARLSRIVERGGNCIAHVANDARRGDKAWLETLAPGAVGKRHIEEPGAARRREMLNAVARVVARLRPAENQRGRQCRDGTARTRVHLFGARTAWPFYLSFSSFIFCTWHGVGVHVG